jgi:hypothetical protein
VYNITSNSWFTLNLSQPRGWFASTSSQNKIFFAGGAKVYNQEKNTVSGPSNVVDIFEFRGKFGFAHNLSTSLFTSKLKNIFFLSSQ